MIEAAGRAHAALACAKVGVLEPLFGVAEREGAAVEGGDGRRGGGGADEV